MTLSRRQRAVQRVYSIVADRVYEPVVVQGTFKLFGGNLHSLLKDQAPEVVRAAGSGPVLDIPVGTAYFTEDLARAHEGLLVGADIAEGMARKAVSAARRRAFDLSVMQADIHRLPFPTGTFRAIACTNGLQVIPDLAGALEELERVLAKGGTLFVSVITLGLSSLLPGHSQKLPTILRAGGDVAAELTKSGFTVGVVRKERRATLIEATKN